MKRNDELIRSILNDVHTSPMQSPGRPIYIGAVPAATISEHLVLLQKHRLIECLIVRESDGTLREALAKQLTAEGREFLQASKNAPVWKKTVSGSKAAGFGAFVKTLRELTVEAAEEAAEKAAAV